MFKVLQVPDMNSHIHCCKRKEEVPARFRSGSALSFSEDKEGCEGSKERPDQKRCPHREVRMVTGVWNDRLLLREDRRNKAGTAAFLLLLLRFIIR